MCWKVVDWLTLCDTTDCSLPRLLCPWNSSGKNTGVSSHSLLWGISPTQGSNLGLPHCRQIGYRLSHLITPCYIPWGGTRTLFYCWTMYLDCFFFVSALGLFSCSAVSDSFVTPWIAAHQASLSSTMSQRAYSNSCSLSQVMPSNHLILCRPFSSCLQSFPASRSFLMIGSLHQVAKVLKLQHQPFYEYSGLISFRIDWFDLLAVQGTRKRLLQHHSSKTSILRCLAFSVVPTLTSIYMTTGKSIVWLYRPLLAK